MVPPPVPGNDTSSDYDYDEVVRPNEAPEINNENPSRFVVENRARGAAPPRPTPDPSSLLPTQNRGQDLQRPVTPLPRPRAQPPTEARPDPRPRAFPVNVPRQQRPEVRAQVPVAAVPNKPEKQDLMDAFSAFQTPFDFTREQIEEIERRRPGATEGPAKSNPSRLRFEAAVPTQPAVNAVRNSSPPAAIPRRPVAKPVAADTRRINPPRAQIPESRPEVRKEVRPEVSRSSLPSIPEAADPRRPAFVVRDPPTAAAPVIPQQAVPRRPSPSIPSNFGSFPAVANNEPTPIRNVPSLVRASAAPATPEPAPPSRTVPQSLSSQPRQRRPIRIRINKEKAQQQQQQPSFIPQQSPPAPEVVQEEPAIRRPQSNARPPLSFDPRKARPSSSSSGTSLPPASRFTPTAEQSSTNSQAPLRVRSRARARRPVGGSNVAERPQRPVPVPVREPVNTPLPATSLPADAFASFPAKPVGSTASEPTFPSFIPKQITDKPAFAPTPIRPPVEPKTKRPSFNAFPAVDSNPSPRQPPQQRERDQPRGLSAFPSFAAVSSPEVKPKAFPAVTKEREEPDEPRASSPTLNGFSAFPARNKESPVLPTRPSPPVVRQPERPFAPTPRSEGATRNGTPSRFSSFPIQSIPSDSLEPIAQEPQRPVAFSRSPPSPSVPLSRNVQQPLQRPADAIPVTRASGPGSTVNFDALIREFTGQQPKNASPSLFNAIPLDTSSGEQSSLAQPQRPRQFQPQPAVPSVTPASFSLFTEL